VTNSAENPGPPNINSENETVRKFTNICLSAQINNPLNWLPENTYTVPSVVLRYDAQ
jgi:hypothetical protein